MKILTKIFYFICFVLINSKFLAVDQANAIKKTLEPKFEIPIRVLIEKKEKISAINWVFESENGFLLIFPENKKRTLIKKSLLNLRGSFNNKLIINGHYCNYTWDNFFIVPLKGNVRFQNNLYDGIFAIAKFENAIFLINHLDLEDYVAAVLHAETWPTWPKEVNFALSICIRSYAVSKILEQRSTKRKLFPFDIKNTTAHQVYKGSQQSLKLKDTVRQTKSLILTYDKRPILAMFDISCGGIIPSEFNNLNKPAGRAPYLARSYKCTYCKNFKCFKWQQVYTFAECEKKLRQIFPKLRHLRSIKIIKKNKAGLAVQLKIEGRGLSFTIGATKFKNLLRLKSLCFNININGNKIILNGRGFGHLTGLCQFGLYQMIKDGWNFKDALKFYYPKTTLMKLVNKC